MRCQATTSKGSPCKNAATGAGHYCRVHAKKAGESSGPADSLKEPDEAEPRLKSIVKLWDRILQHRVAQTLLLISGLTGLVTAPIALLLSVDSIEERELVYAIHGYQTVVYDHDETPGFQLTRNGLPVEQDLKLFHVAIWNEGNAPIKREHVVDTLRISFDTKNDADSMELWNVRVWGESRESVIDADVEFIAPESGSASQETRQLQRMAHRLVYGVVGLPIQFKILEPGDGFVVQVTYSCDQNPTVSLAGAIEGQQSIEPFDNSAQPRNLLLGLVGATLAGFAFSLEFFFREIFQPVRWKRKLFVVAVIVVLSIVLISVTQLAESTTVPAYVPGRIRPGSHRTQVDTLDVHHYHSTGSTLFGR